MATPASGDLVVITPIYWQPSGFAYSTKYASLLNRYLSDAAADSEKTTNVFSTLFEYNGSNGNINYRFKRAAPLVDTNPYPAAGCPTNSGSIYADGSGYTTCLDDAQVTAEIDAQITAHSWQRGLGHIYVMFLPKHVESCFEAAGQTCTINSTPSAAYCAYHGQFSGNTVYANMPFPIYKSAAGHSCTDEHLGGATSTIQAPNGHPDADVEISPLSHEVSEAITDPDVKTGWYDANGYENGDDCAYVYGALAGSNGTFSNQVIHGHKYLTQDEFSNAAFAGSGGTSGCLQHASSTIPAVTHVSPTSGSAAGGKTVTITGTGFPGTTTVSFGGTSATAFTIVDASTIKATTPAHAVGPADITVSTSAGTSPTTPADTYTYQ